MKTRTAAVTTFASAAALMLALAPAQASETTTTTDTFSSSTGLSSRSTAAPHAVPSLPSAADRQRAAKNLMAADPISKYTVRGYQTLYASGYNNELAGDVTVDLAPSEYCYILSTMNVNGVDRDELAESYAGVSYPEADEDFGGPTLPPTYGAATYRFGPHIFIDGGADGDCSTDTEAAPNYVVAQSQKLSNAVRIRYQAKGSVQYKKTGSKVKVHVLSQRFDKSGKYVGQRSIKLQYRKAGATTWSTKKTMSLDVTGRGDYSFTSSAKYYYRVYTPLTDNVQSAYSPPSYL